MLYSSFPLASYFTHGSGYMLDFPVVKNLPANGRDIRDGGSIPGSGRSSGGGHGNPPQYSCLENPMNEGAWRAIVYEVTGEGHN